MVPFVASFFDFYSCQVTTTQRYPHVTIQWSLSSNGQESIADWSYCVRKSLQNRVVPADATETIIGSWLFGTRKQHTSAWKK